MDFTKLDKLVCLRAFLSLIGLTTLSFSLFTVLIRCFLVGSVFVSLELRCFPPVCFLSATVMTSEGCLIVFLFLMVSDDEIFKGFQRLALA